MMNGDFLSPVGSALPIGEIVRRLILAFSIRESGQEDHEGENRSDSDDAAEGPEGMLDHCGCHALSDGTEGLAEGCRATSAFRRTRGDGGALE